jgi:hypothetical protein
VDVIKINCDGSTYLELDQLTEFQGELKKRTKKDIDTVAGLIEKYGFSFPFFVWKKGKKNMVLDGHGRILALKKLRDNGEEIPALPACYIKAKDEEEAKKKLLHLNSQYGVMTAKSVMEFTSGILLDFSEIQLSNGTELKFQEESEEKYTRKVETPIYQITGEKPAIKELYDNSKQKELEKKILASNIPEDEKEFLIQASMRHVVFNYKKIAEFYAHAGKETQELMEDSALIIIDFEKAIEKGFVRLTKDLGEQYKQEEENEE